MSEAEPTDAVLAQCEVDLISLGYGALAARRSIRPCELERLAALLEGDVAVMRRAARNLMISVLHDAHGTASRHRLLREIGQHLNILSGGGEARAFLSVWVRKALMLLGVFPCCRRDLSRMGTARGTYLAGMLYHLEDAVLWLDERERAVRAEEMR